MSSKFRGLGVAVVTPFHKDGSIDFKSFSGIIEHLIKGKVNYIVVLGSTGEAVTMSKDEKYAVINCAIDTVEKRIPIVLGIGGNNTSEIVKCVQKTDFTDIDGILSVSPAYNKPSQKGIYLHFRAIANESPVPVIIYNVPGRTGSNITADTTIKLATDFSNIIAVKEASGNLDQCMTIIKNKPKNFLVISGDDALTLPLIALGADGIISVVGNAFPKQFSELVQLCFMNDFKKAAKIHFALIDIINSLFAEGNPAGIKAALEIRNLCQNYLRLPLTPVSKTQYHYIEEMINAYIG